MEIKVNEIMLPAEIGWNYDEIKDNVSALAKKYSGMVYTDDDFKAAKEDRAALNKLKKALNDERLKREREYMEPFAKFKAQVNEVIKIIDEPVKLIDTQVKAYQERQKEEKRKAVQEIIAEVGIDVMQDCYWDPRWLNEGTSLNKVRKELENIAEKVKSDYTIIHLQLQEHYAAVAMEHYQKTMDLSAAFAKAKEMADYDEMKRRMAEERVEVAEEEPVTEAPEGPTAEDVPEDIPDEFLNMGANNWEVGVVWKGLEVRVDVSQEYALQQFLKRKGIEYRWL